MQIVIEISEEIYDLVQDKLDFNGDLDKQKVKTLMLAIDHGIPLPKGHGRLIDADLLRSMYSINRANFNTVVGIQKWIDNAPTILEAWNGESE